MRQLIHTGRFFPVPKYPFKIVSEVFVYFKNTEGIQNAHPIVAQWDTGAVCTVIREDLAKDFELEFLDRTKILTTASGDIIKAKIYKLDFAFESDMNFEQIEIAAIDNPEQKEDIIIGMDFIETGDLILKHDGEDLMLKFIRPKNGFKPLNEMYEKYLK